MFKQKLRTIPHQNLSEENRAIILDPVMSSLNHEEKTLYSSKFDSTLDQRVSESRRRRIALYCHDTLGLEHTRRNLRIAQILANSSLQVDILIISGSWEVSTLSLPPNVDCLTLPALYNTAEGQYKARSLNISLPDITELRSKVIQVAIAGFDPDLLIVDKAPRGVMEELSATLEYLQTQAQVQCVLWLHDALDDLATRQPDWSYPAHEDVIRDAYDAIWIHGDIADQSTDHAYRFPQDVAAKIRYTGYLDQRSWRKYAAASTGLFPSELAWCMVNGGKDVTQSGLTTDEQNGLDLNGCDRLLQLVEELINRGPSDSDRSL